MATRTPKTTPAKTPASEKSKPKSGSETASVEAKRDALVSFAWSGRNLIVGDEEKLAKIRRKNLSASTMAKVTQCPASFAAESVMPRLSDPMAANELGTGAHSVMELLYDLPAAERTREALISFVPQVADEQLAPYTDRTDFAAIREAWMKEVEGFSLGIYSVEDPTTIDVYKTELNIKGAVLPNGVPFIGFIDRTIRLDGDPDRLSVDDYKFGKYKAPNPRFGDQYADQIRLYRIAFEAELGVIPEQGRLIYPRAGKTRVIDLSEPMLRETLRGFKSAWDQMHAFSDDASFPTRPGNLCAWCPLANSCPVANIKSANAIEHAKTQPSKVELGIPTVPQRPTPRISDAASIDSLEEPMTNAPKRAYPNDKWGAIAATGLANFATAHLSIHGQALRPDSINSLARLLATIVERANRSLFGTFDWSHDSVSRMVYAVEASMKDRPAPFGGTAEDWKTWAGNIAKLSAARFEAGLDLMVNHSVSEEDFNHLATVTTAHVASPTEA